MTRRVTRTTLLGIMVVLLALGLSSVALAAGWSDLPASKAAKYGITEADVTGISQGFADGTWKPDQLVTRAQFTKMAVEAFGVAMANPTTPSFKDVPANHQYYQYIEGAKAAGLVNGVTATEFAPDDTMTHEQCFAIVTRWVAETIGIDLEYVYHVPVSTMTLVRLRRWRRGQRQPDRRGGHGREVRCLPGRRLGQDPRSPGQGEQDRSRGRPGAGDEGRRRPAGPFSVRRADRRSRSIVQTPASCWS